jgi:hypothetical protein
MEELVIGIALTWLIGLQTPSPAANAHEIAWRAVGVAPASRASVDDAQPQRFAVRGFFDVAWHPRSAPVTFLRIPGTEPYFVAASAEREAADGYVAWRNEIAPSMWAREEPVLRLVQAGNSARAEGRLHLGPPLTTGNPVRAAQVPRVDEFRSGCAMEYRFDLPVNLQPGGVELDFAWDLHSALQLDNLRLLPSSAAGTLPSIAIELDAPDPASRIEPPELDFSAAPDARAIVRVIPRRGLRARLHALAHPPCIELTRVEPIEGGWQLEFESRALACAFHACEAARIDVLVGDDPQPYTHFIRVRHGARVTDEDGSRVVCGVFAPGEQVELRSDGEHIAWCLPDRLSCAPSLLESFGFQCIARFRAPQTPGIVDERFGTAAGAFRVAAMATGATLVHAEAWSVACRR